MFKVNNVVFIINFEQISNVGLLFTFLTFNKYMVVEMMFSSNRSGLHKRKTTQIA